MRNALLVMLVSLAAASSALADPYRAPSSDKPAAASRQLPLKGAAAGDSCAVYGAGFVKAAGSETCVKIGGAFSVETGVRR